MPSVNVVGKNTRAFWAVSLSGTTELMLTVPTSTVLRSSGQTSEGSFVGSPAFASWTIMRNLIGPLADAFSSSASKKIGRLRLGIRLGQVLLAGDGEKLVAACVFHSFVVTKMNASLEKKAGVPKLTVRLGLLQELRLRGDGRR